MMNKELYERSTDAENRSKELRTSIKGCEGAINNIMRDGDIVFKGVWSVGISACGLDVSQREVINNVISSILQTRIKELEDKLEKLLPIEQVGKHPLPPRTHE